MECIDKIIYFRPTRIDITSLIVQILITNVEIDRRETDELPSINKRNIKRLILNRDN